MIVAVRPTVVEALSAVMGDVQAVGKGDTNTQQGYKFRGIDAVVNAVGPALRKHGIVVVPIAATVAFEHYTTARGTPMKGVTATVTFRFYGPAGDFIDAQTCGESSDSGDKAVPKAHSVAFRTMLLQALCIPTDEPDPDADSHERAAPAKQAATPAATATTTPFAPPDGLGLQASRADADAGDDGQPGNVQVFFGTNAGKRLVDLTPRQRQWYAESWAPNNPQFPVGAKERRLRQAARMLCGTTPTVETDGPFAADDSDVPF